MSFPSFATTTRPIFRAIGSVRGYGPRRTTPGAALRDCARDHADCASLGGGAYSDRVPFAVVDGGEYRIGCAHCESLTGEHSATPAELLAIVGEEIAAGRGLRRPRLACDDWAGWVVCSGALYCVSVRWPDNAEAHEATIEASHICDVE